MTYAGIQLWADSIGKGVVFDEARGRYAIARERCAVRLQEALSVPIANHSRMGATAAEGLENFLSRPAGPGAIAAIAYGGNDCDMPWKDISENPDAAYDAKIPLPDFAKTLADFVSAARARGMRPLLVTPPPLEAERYFAWVCRGLSSEAILRFLGDMQHIYRWQERYAIAVRRVAEDMRCALFDLRDAFLAHRRLPSLYCIDGIHPNAEGHAVIAAAVLSNRERLATQLEKESWSAASNLVKIGF